MPGGQRVNLLLRPSTYMSKKKNQKGGDHLKATNNNLKKIKNFIKNSARKEVQESECGRKLYSNGTEIDVWLSNTMQRARERSGCWKDEQHHGRKSGRAAMVVE